MRSLYQFALLVAVTAVLVVLGLSLDRCYHRAAFSGHDPPAPVSCPMSDEIAALRLALADIDGRATWAHEAASALLDDERSHAEDIADLTGALSQGLVDVACLYRGHLAQTHFGYQDDRPVPGAWSPLSPHVPEITAEMCEERFRRSNSTHPLNFNPSQRK